jgi:hypothetical protein
MKNGASLGFERTTEILRNFELDAPEVHRF